MIIENKDYILEQISKDSHFFDLTFPKVINKGKDNERIEFKDPLYGLTIEHAKKRIALWRINKQLVDSDKVSPEQFSTMYLKEKKLIDEELVNL